ncbi:hypothetical protein SELMODRAFT_165961 [Selaginella moellendorffii]|uniref:4-hydroxyphenylpyruvate dioxygenase n=2 Tax=Selaginella moellendorffii TaxID=88036 RepID=D8QY42_SELML|nr:hypothetical protein SELMODRAFT_165961 [Selaginella moellendorffii]
MAAASSARHASLSSPPSSSSSSISQSRATAAAASPRSPSPRSSPRRSSSVLEHTDRAGKVDVGKEIEQQRRQRQDLESKAKSGLVGFDKFVRSNPLTDRFKVLCFHHVELWCGDATNTWRRFSWGLGMPLVAKSDQTTGNHVYCSYALQSEELVLVFSAPYSDKHRYQPASPPPHPAMTKPAMLDFFDAHGLAVRAVGVRVEDAATAFRTSVEHGAIAVLEPTTMHDVHSGQELVLSEVALYGDVVLRFVSGGFDGPFLPGYERVSPPPFSSSPSGLGVGLCRLDHAVGNVHNLLDAARYVAGFTGFHEFAEFTAEDIGTCESGLNSMVLASNNEMVLLPMNEPVHGTRRKSQIQTYLDHNEGPGLQHLAISCRDIFHTLREMRMRSHIGGFEFMPRPNKKYYRDLPERIGSSLTPEQVEMCEELGILVDKDDQGILLQIFTKPVGDRPTLFLEIIQRVGCMEENVQRGGCGGFGKGNFAALFKSIEDYEKTLER